MSQFNKLYAAPKHLRESENENSGRYTRDTIDDFSREDCAEYLPPNEQPPRGVVPYGCITYYNADAKKSQSDPFLGTRAGPLAGPWAGGASNKGKKGKAAPKAKAPPKPKAVPKAKWVSTGRKAVDGKTVYANAATGQKCVRVVTVKYVPVPKK